MGQKWSGQKWVPRRFWLSPGYNVTGQFHQYLISTDNDHLLIFTLFAALHVDQYLVLPTVLYVLILR